MRNFYYLSFLCFLGISTAFSQDISDHTIGLRFSQNSDDNIGVEISYQNLQSDVNRLEFNLGWRSNRHYSSYKLSGIYQKVWLIDGGFNWYIGGGAGFGSWSIENTDHSGFYVFGAGDIGIEYNFFNIPLLLSLDFRPELNLSISGDKTDSFNSSFGFGIRYQF